MRDVLPGFARNLLLAALVTAPLTAQADPACPSAVDQLAALTDSVGYPALVITLAACGPVFAPALVAEWATPPTSNTALRGLSTASARARSPQMFAVIKRVIQDREATVAVRIAAIEATAGWVNPCMEVRIHGVADDRNARLTATTSIRSECDRGYGPSGPYSVEAEELISTLRRIRPTSAELAVQTAAAAMAYALEHPASPTEP